MTVSQLNEDEINPVARPREPIYDKVKAAAITVIVAGVMAALDQSTDLDLGFLGEWAFPVGAALATGAAYAKKEITAWRVRESRLRR